MPAQQQPGLALRWLPPVEKYPAQERKRAAAQVEFLSRESLVLSAAGIRAGCRQFIRPEHRAIHEVRRGFDNWHIEACLNRLYLLGAMDLATADQAIMPGVAAEARNLQRFAEPTDRLDVTVLGQESEHHDASGEKSVDHML